ncbi:MAG: flavin reductase family protein [Nocardioidaceae bacterium]
MSPESTDSTESTGAFDGIATSLDPPLLVVSTATNGERAGCLVGFHAQSSIDPVRYCVWISKANHTYRLAVRAGHLALHFLTVDDLAVAERFGTTSGDDVDKFAGLRVEAGPDGVPLLLDCPHRLVVRRTALLDDGGDHVCLTTQTVRAESPGPFRPLRLSQADHLVPGHDSDERQ